MVRFIKLKKKCTKKAGWGRIAQLSPVLGSEVPFEKGFLENPFSPTRNTTFCPVLGLHGPFSKPSISFMHVFHMILVRTLFGNYYFVKFSALRANFSTSKSCCLFFILLSCKFQVTGSNKASFLWENWMLDVIWCPWADNLCRPLLQRGGSIFSCFMALTVTHHLWQSTGGKWWLTHWASMLRWIWSISEYNLRPARDSPKWTLMSGPCDRVRRGSGPAKQKPKHDPCRPVCRNWKVPILIGRWF